MSPNPSLPPLPPVDHIITVPMIGQSMGVLHNDKDFLDWIGQVSPNYADDGRAAHAAVHYCEREDGSPVLVAFLPKGSKPATLVHEAVHAAWFMLNISGIDIDVDNHEAQAYLVDHLFTRFSEVCRRTRKARD